MDSKFTTVSLNEKDMYYAFWDATPQRSLDYTLANLWGWKEFYGLEWLFGARLCWIRQTKGQTAWWAPIGDWQSYDWKEVAPALSGRKFTRVPEKLLHVWQEQLPDMFEAEDERGQWEYLYSQEDLADLPGNRFHKKRNHFNSYVKTYGEPDYRPVTQEMVKDVLNVQDVWCHWHECEDSPSLRAENDAITRVLTQWENFRNLVGGSLYVEGKMIAFSVGEKLDADDLGVHFEKGLNGFKGVYQAMNCEFARHAGEGFKWINRAQDLDEEGLRQAKMTYLPEGFLRKYQVVFK